MFLMPVSLWLKKAALIPMGLLAGVLISIAGVQVWDQFHSMPIKISAVDRDALRRMLDEDHSSRGLYLYDEQVGYRFKPHFRGIRHKSKSDLHQTNSVGLLGVREIELHPSKPRVLFLGDSVPYGDSLPFESTFSSLVETGQKATWHCYNGSCPGWNLQQQLPFFQSSLAPLSMGTGGISNLLERFR